jgi:hypothetical protein
MTSDDFVPAGFVPPTSLVTDEFRLGPLGPQHNESDHAAWMSSIEHIRSTPGYLDGRRPPGDGMTLEANLADLRRHAADFAGRTGFTFTVLDPDEDDVIGCVYLYPSRRRRMGRHGAVVGASRPIGARRPTCRRRRALAGHRLAVGARQPLRPVTPRTSELPRGRNP